MKSIFRNFLLLSLIFAASTSQASSQNKNNEKKIKIIVDNGTGPKTLIDTTFSKASMPDSIKLSNGEVIYLKESELENNLKAHECCPKKITVTGTSGKNSNEIKEEKTMTICISGSDSTLKAGNSREKHVYSYSSAVSNGTKPGCVMIVSSSDDKRDADGGKEKVIIIRDSKTIEKNGSKICDVNVNSSGNDTLPETTTYMLAKNGVRVTIEGDNEIKTKELAKKIEELLDTATKDNVKK